MNPHYATSLPGTPARSLSPRQIGGLLCRFKTEDANKIYLQLSFCFLLLTQISFAQPGDWTKLGDMPEDRYGHTVNEINGKIYIVGGMNYELSVYPRTALVFDRSSGEWTHIPLCNNTIRAAHTSCVVDGKLYVIGGNDSTRTLSTMDMFDPATGEWMPKKSMPTDRGLAACASIDGKIYVMGGLRSLGSQIWKDGFSTVEVYDTHSDTWTQMADMPIKNWGLSAVAVNGKIYVLGGTTGTGLASPVYASVEVYDPQTNTWTTHSKMPTARYCLTACLWDGDIYAIGGWLNSAAGPLYDKVEIYNPDRDEWKTECPLPVKRAVLASIVLDGKITIYGGSRTTHPNLGTSEIYEFPTTVAHAHDGALDRHYARPGLNTVCVTAVLSNPLHHAASMSAVVTDTLGALRDCVPLCNDGLHGDGSAGDSLWGCAVRAPSDEGFFDVDVRTDDITQGTCRPLVSAMHFTTAGPVTLDSTAVTKQASKYRLKPYLRNVGAASTIHGAMVALTCKDPWIDSINPPQVGLPDLAPGATNAVKSLFTATLNTEPFPGHFNVKVEVSIDGWVYWSDSTRVTVTGIGVADRNGGLPDAFALDQNYPNPFNPVTTIRYALPRRCKITLTVLNLLGQEVIAFAEGEREAGYHEVRFDGRNLESGVYFCRLQAGDFIQARKLVLLK